MNTTEQASWSRLQKSSSIRVKKCKRGVDDLQAFTTDIGDNRVHDTSTVIACPLLWTYDAYNLT